MLLNVFSICRTPLHYASAHNHPDVVTLLLENKSNINIQDDEGCTPLIKVAMAICFGMFWCPCLVSVAVRKHRPRLTQESKNLFGFHLFIPIDPHGKPGQELKSGTRGKN